MFKIGDIVHCGGCEKPVPLARRTAITEFELVKFVDGQKVNIITSYEGGLYRVTCAECKTGHIFTHIKESITINE